MRAWTGARPSKNENRLTSVSRQAIFLSATACADVENYKVLAKAITDSSKTLEEFQTEMLKSVDEGKERLKKLAK